MGDGGWEPDFSLSGIRVPNMAGQTKINPIELD